MILDLLIARQRLVAAILTGVAASAIGAWAVNSPTLALGAALAAMLAVTRPTLAMFALFTVNLACHFGLVNLSPLWRLGPFNASDSLLGILMVFTAPVYLRQRRKIASAWFRRLEFAWLLLIGLIAVEALRSPARSILQQLVDLHIVEGYVLFFPTVAVVNSRARFHQVVCIGLIFALAGTVLTLAQSLHGLQNLFDSPYYETGSWPGNKQLVGDVARVNLPISDWISFVLLILFGVSLLRPRWWYLPIAVFLSIAILLNFARSLWLSMLAGMAVEALILAVHRRVSVGKVVILLVIIPIVFLLSLQIAAYLGFAALPDALQSRVEEGFVTFESGTGTWGARLDQADLALHLWQNDPIWGIGTDYLSVTGQWIDLALPMTLMSIGIAGLVTTSYLAGTCCLAALSTVPRALSIGRLEGVALAAAVPAYTMWIIVVQAWVDPLAFAILGFVSGLAMITSAISTETQAPPDRSIAHASPAQRYSEGQRVYARWVRTEAARQAEPSQL